MPNNPTPGRYYLKHVGFLGAIQPAVDGLRPVEFSAFTQNDGDSLIVSLAGYEGYIRHNERTRINREIEILDLADRLTGKIGRKVIIRPCDKDAFIALATHISNNDMTISFGSNDLAQNSDPFSFFKKLMLTMSPLLTLGEIDKFTKESYSEGADVKLSMPNGFDVDTSMSDLHLKAVSFQKNNGCDYRTAVLAVSKQRSY